VGFSSETNSRKEIITGQQKNQINEQESVNWTNRWTRANRRKNAITASDPKGRGCFGEPWDEEKIRT